MSDDEPGHQRVGTIKTGMDAGTMDAGKIESGKTDSGTMDSGTMNSGASGSLAELQQVIQKKYDLAPDAIDPDKPMTELGLDSLAVAEFLFEVEDHFSIRLSDDDPEIDTLRKLSVLVDQTIAAKEAATT